MRPIGSLAFRRAAAVGADSAVPPHGSRACPSFGGRTRHRRPRLCVCLPAAAVLVKKVVYVSWRRRAGRARKLKLSDWDCSEGKGRKQRCTPLRQAAAAVLRAWLDEQRGEPDSPVFPNQRGGALSHDGLAYLVARNVAVARQACPSLKNKCVIAEGLRHTAAMELLQDGVDRAVTALWLGHASVETTYVYRPSTGTPISS